MRKLLFICLIFYLVSCSGSEEVQETTTTTVQDTTTTIVQDTTTTTVQENRESLPDKVFQTLNGQELNHISNRYLASFDMNNDGLEDLVLGRNNTTSDKKGPIKIYLNNGDGTFKDGTTSLLTSTPYAFDPIGTAADFNNDGILDIAILDKGDNTKGQMSSGGYVGGEPILLLSNGTKWDLSNAFIDAVKNAEDNECWPNCTTTLHAKSITAGDIDNDGDIDLYIESGGGYNNPNPHFMINNGDATFQLDASEKRRSNSLIWGESGSHRFARQILIDINGDGFLDLVMGQLRRINNQQENLSSMIIFNDGSGDFTSENSLNLPYTPWNNGWTYVKNIVSVDLNKDGLIDLILSHERGNLIPDPDNLGNTGRYLQALIQQKNGNFIDESDSWFGNQGETTVSKINIQGNETSNYNGITNIFHIDINKDGEKDLFFETDQQVGIHSPLIMLYENFQFIPVDYEEITLGESWWGRNSFPIDLNGDGFYDFIHLYWNSGEDNIWGNEDDYSIIIPTFINY